MRAFLASALVAAAAAAALAQAHEPVATMFREDLKRDADHAESFQPLELPAAGAAAPLQVYLSAGDLERAFDEPRFRPDAAIVPTNTGLVVTAAWPATQRVLVSRVSKQKPALAALQAQIAERRQQAPGSEPLRVGVDAFLARFTPGALDRFPKAACLIATEFPSGGAVDRRELFAQDRVRQGVAGCLAAIDRTGAASVLIPLLGASSGKTQARDPGFDGQRRLLECRQINSAAGIALGVHDFAAARRSIRAIGIVQYDKEITAMFGSGRLAQAAYRAYAGQMTRAVTRGIAGDKTTPADVDGSCAATFNVP